MKTNSQSTQSMATMNAHLDIPGNPSLAKSSISQLNDGKSGKPLRALSQEEFDFWKREGYIVVKNAISKNKQHRLPRLFGSLRKKTQMIKVPGILHQGQTCK